MTKPINLDSNCIEQFLHCKLCSEEVHSGNTDTGQSESPRNYAKYEVGWTKWGIQIWCIRHNANILHIDFEGHTHPACLTRDPKTTKQHD